MTQPPGNLPSPQAAANAPPRSRFAPAHLLMCFIVAIVLAAIVANMQQRFFTLNHDALMVRLGALDHDLIQVSDGSPLYIRMENFLGDSAGYATNIYFRAVYTLYPIPVYVSPDPIRINFPRDVLIENADASRAWLRAHNVPRTLVFYVQNDQILKRVEFTDPAAAPTTQ